VLLALDSTQHTLLNAFNAFFQFKTELKFIKQNKNTKNSKNRRKLRKFLRSPLARAKDQNLLRCCRDIVRTTLASSRSNLLHILYPPNFKKLCFNRFVVLALRQHLPHACRIYFQQVFQNSTILIPYNVADFSISTHVATIYAYKYNLVTYKYNLVTYKYNLVTYKYNLVTYKYNLVTYNTRGHQHHTRRLRTHTLTHITILLLLLLLLYH
jgi:hypothetical protein